MGAPAGGTAGAGIQPFGGGTTMVQMPGTLQQTMPALASSVSAPGAATAAGAPMGAVGEMAGGMPGMPGAPGMAPGAGVTPTAAVAPTVPLELSWALPAYVPLQPGQTEWLYRRGDATLGFILDEDGAVIGIIVAGRKFDAARTALGNPFKTICLGDSLQRVLARYGWPDEVRTFNVETIAPTSNVMSRDVELRYHRSSNIVFTLRNFRVIRIFIFIPGRVGPG